MTLALTPSQTIGPFSHDAWQWACAACAPSGADASTVTISGTLLDGDGNPINDGMIEAWTPGAAAFESGRGQALAGFRRVASGENGDFQLLLPRGPADSGEPAALVTVFARGLLVHQFTAVFLEDDALARSDVLNQVPTERRGTLIARKNAADQYHWDIRMQGPEETVFFVYGSLA
jgi:protocatechuate 3,4-dioxygenase alpha subunit